MPPPVSAAVQEDMVTLSRVATPAAWSPPPSVPARHPVITMLVSASVPALLMAGGKEVRMILESGAWRCNSWDNCPMAVAFEVHSPEDIPALYQPRVDQFVQMFDAGLIPEPPVGSY